MTRIQYFSYSGYISFAFLFLMALTSGGCQDNPESSSLGKEFVDSHTRVSLIDTFSVSLSTVILDTMITSGTENILIGNYRDEQLGGIASESFLQLGIPESFDVQSRDLYDSLRLILTYNQYAFGDTTRSQRILVHQLTEEIDYDYSAVIASSTSFGYEQTPLGALSYLPSPNGSSTTLSIPIDDDLGRGLFQQLVDVAETVTNNASFRTYLPGLLLKADPATTGGIIGFNATSADLRLVLYTRKADTFEENPITFALQDSSRQFNHIIHDFTATQLASLKEQRFPLVSGKTGGSSFLQGGVGLAIRVDFPTLSEALLITNSTLLSAELSLFPRQASYQVIGLPADLTVYESDGLNRIVSIIGYSTLTVDDLYGEETAYTFDLTAFLRAELADSYVDPEHGLLIMLPAGDATTCFSRLISDATSKHTKLSLHYLSY
jgi:hypothetical protein